MDRLNHKLGICEERTGKLEDKKVLSYNRGGDGNRKKLRSMENRMRRSNIKNRGEKRFEDFFFFPEFIKEI